MPRRLLLVLAVFAVALAPALHPAGQPSTVGSGPALGTTGRPAYPDSLFAPLDRPGPVFSVPAPALAASLRCAVPHAGGPPRAPVLLLSSTGLDTSASFDWNYQPALSAVGITWCTSNAPGANNGDIQLRAEYVAYAVREMRARAGRLVDVIGHGQGALAARVALRFWPDLRDDVSDLIALAPPNQGSAAFQTVCSQACPAAYWQQRPDSMLVSAVNSRQPTFAGVDYTVITSTIDDVITPQPVASTLRTGSGRIRTIAVQDVCPGYVADHLGIGGYDAVAWAIAADALNNLGPADPARLSRAVCGAGFMPAIDTERFLGNSARAAPVLETIPPAGVPTVSAEPAPRCWVLAAGCLSDGAP
ncbi:MAG: lipase [Pseudonocardiales bacterium]|nr:lipase [Pseudonocardiales bacterium]